MTRPNPAPHAAAAIAIGAVVLNLLAAAPAQALPPTTRTVKDAVQPAKAYDIVEVKLRGAPDTKHPAVVVIKHSRKVATGDVIDVWFDLDGDRVPDLHVSGDAFSEFTVHRTKSFTKNGRDISDKDCARLAMAGSTSKVRLFPSCLGSPLAFSVSVKSSVFKKPTDTADWAPAAQTFTKKVLAAPLT